MQIIFITRYYYKGYKRHEGIKRFYKSLTSVLVTFIFIPLILLLLLHRKWNGGRQDIPMNKIYIGISVVMVAVRKEATERNTHKGP